MTQQEQQYLTQIKNTLMEVSTKGQDTILMSECLKALTSLINSPVEVDTEKNKEE